MNDKNITAYVNLQTGRIQIRVKAHPLQVMGKVANQVTVQDPLTYLAAAEIKARK